MINEAREILARALRRPRVLAARILLCGIGDLERARLSSSVRGLVGFVLMPPTSRDLFDAVRASIATRLLEAKR